MERLRAHSKPSWSLQRGQPEEGCLRRCLGGEPVFTLLRALWQRPEGLVIISPCQAFQRLIFCNAALGTSQLSHSQMSQEPQIKRQLRKPLRIPWQWNLGSFAWLWSLQADSWKFLLEKDATRHDFKYPFGRNLGSAFACPSMLRKWWGDEAFGGHSRF